MTTVTANVEMARIWDGDEGDDWARDWERYDRSVRAHHLRLLDAAAIVAGERVLDIGCGNGESTREAARASGHGDVLGVDLSSRMIARASALARDQGRSNARFDQADAQVHAFTPGGYDVAVSRFGTMFFADPAAAYVNIARALRPGGRLVMTGWRSLGDNEWLGCVLGALAAGRDLPAPRPGTPGPLGLADPGRIRETLQGSGFGDVRLEAVDAPLWLGCDADDAFAFMSTSGVARGMLGGADGPTRTRAMAALRATMAEHETADGVVFGSGAWLVSAVRAAG